LNNPVSFSSILTRFAPTGFDLRGFGGIKNKIMDTYTKAQIIEIIFRQQGEEETLINRLSQKVANSITDEQFQEMVKKSDIPLKDLGYNRYYIA